MPDRSVIPSRLSRRQVRERLDWLQSAERRRVRIELVRALRNQIGSLNDTDRWRPVVVLTCHLMVDASVEALVGLRHRPGMSRFPKIRMVLTWFDADELDRLLRIAA